MADKLWIDTVTRSDARKLVDWWNAHSSRYRFFIGAAFHATRGARFAVHAETIDR